MEASIQAVDPDLLQFSTKTPDTSLHPQPLLSFTKTKNWPLKLLEEVVDLVFVISSKTLDILYTAPSCKSSVGFIPHEIIGHNLEKFIHPGDVRTVTKALQKIKTTGNSYRIYIRFRRKNTDYILLELVGRPLTQLGNRSNNSDDMPILNVGREYPTRLSVAINSIIDLRIENASLQGQLKAIKHRDSLADDATTKLMTTVIKSLPSVLTETSETALDILTFSSSTNSQPSSTSLPDISNTSLISDQWSNSGILTNDSATVGTILPRFTGTTVRQDFLGQYQQLIHATLPSSFSSSITLPITTTEILHTHRHANGNLLLQALLPFEQVEPTNARHSTPTDGMLLPSVNGENPLITYNTALDIHPMPTFYNDRCEASLRGDLSATPSISDDSSSSLFASSEVPVGYPHAFTTPEIQSFHSIYPYIQGMPSITHRMDILSTETVSDLVKSSGDNRVDPLSMNLSQLSSFDTTPYIISEVNWGGNHDTLTNPTYINEQINHNQPSSLITSVNYTSSGFLEGVEGITQPLPKFQPDTPMRRRSIDPASLHTVEQYQLQLPLPLQKQPSRLACNNLSFRELSSVPISMSKLVSTVTDSALEALKELYTTTSKLKCDSFHPNGDDLIDNVTSCQLLNVSTAGDSINAQKRARKRPSKLPLEELVCVDCGTTQSPEWRKGPSGAKTYALLITIDYISTHFLSAFYSRRKQDFLQQQTRENRIIGDTIFSGDTTTTNSSAH